MLQGRNVSWDEAGHQLGMGKIGVIPTDTVYGLVASVDDKIAVDRIYAVKGRDFAKPFIILIEDVESLARFGISQADAQKAAKYWPGRVSVVLQVSAKFRDHTQLDYLLRHGDTLAFRLPDDDKLRALLHQTGPLVAPSANPEGLPPATTLARPRPPSQAGDLELKFGGSIGQ